MFKEIKTSPLNEQSLRDLDQIYVNLLLLNDSCNREIEPMDYEKLLEMITDEKEKSRILLIGEAGVGKTTLLSKLAHDWATGKCLADIDLLLFDNLRQSRRKRLLK